MKIVITGSLGNISQPLTKQLVQQGHSVMLISSKAGKQPAIEALGATAAIGSVEDADFLAATFTGADAVYCMIPPNLAAPDFRAYYQAIGRNYARAIQRAGVSRVVHLSSWGADLTEGTGFIVGSHDVEGILNELAEVSLTHLRAGYFYYNLYNYIGMIKGDGIMGANYGGDDQLVLVAPADVAAAAAEELTTPAAAGRYVRYVASDERSVNEVVHAVGTAIGMPNLRWLAFADAQMQAGMEYRGIPAHVAAKFVELGSSIHSGTLRQDYDQNKPRVMGRVKLEEFVQEFAAAFQKS